MSGCFVLAVSKASLSMGALMPKEGNKGSFTLWSQVHGGE